MKKIKIVRILLITVVIFSVQACSSSLGTIFTPIAEIPSGKSLLYLYRPEDNFNTIFNIKYNNSEIGDMEKGGYFPIIITPGKTRLTSQVIFKLFTTGLIDAAAAGTTEAVIEAESGKIYFIECTAGGGLMDTGQELSMRVVTENYGSSRIRQCRLLPVQELNNSSAHLK